MAKIEKTVKRITKIMKLDINHPSQDKYYGEFIVDNKDDEPYMPTESISTQYKMYLPDWRRLGKPNKIRVTISVVE